MLSLPAARQEPAQTAWEQGTLYTQGTSPAQSSETCHLPKIATLRGCQQSRVSTLTDACRCCGTYVTQISWHKSVFCWLSHTLLPLNRSWVSGGDLLENCAKQMSPSHQGVLLAGFGRGKQILLWAMNILAWKGMTEGIAAHKMLNNMEKMTREYLVCVLENTWSHQS